MVSDVIDGLETDPGKRDKEDRAALEAHWRDWVKFYFPDFANFDFADHHAEFWEWVWKIEKGIQPKAFVGIWPRGGAKSSSAEMAAVALGALKKRSYVWYCCETQEQADKHVSTIGELLEDNDRIEANYPLLARRDVNMYGHSKGWRRNRLRAANGLIVDAIGLDTAQRGSKVKEKRPDLIIFDDIDGRHDSEDTTRKKKEKITTSLLPAGSSDVAIIMIQNLIHPKSIFSQIASGKADFLYNRIVSGPFPAIRGLVVEFREFEDGETAYEITGGQALWEGQSIEIAQQQINTWGISAFRSESQHEVQAPPGGIWDHVIFRHCKRADVPDLLKGAVWVDPAVTNKDKSDSHAIQADGIASDAKKTIYRLYSWEQRTSPTDSIFRAIIVSFRFGFRTIGIETDQGGDTWRSVYREAWRTVMNCARALWDLKKAEREFENHKRSKNAKEALEKARADLEALDEVYVGMVRPFADDIISGRILRPRFKQAKAGSGHGSKVERNARMLADYELGRIVHVEGTHEALENSLKRFPLTPPHDLTDASYWSWSDLRGTSKGAYF